MTMEKIFQNGPGLYFIAVFEKMTSIGYSKAPMALPRVLLIRSSMLDDRLQRKTWEISMKKLIVNPTTIENRRDLINDACLWVIYMKRKNPRGINPSRLIVMSKRLFRNLL